MASLDIAGLFKSFGTTPVLRGVDLNISDGEFIVFVGPSGCGKSTLLRSIAGLEEPDDGDILIDGRSIIDTDPAKRGIAMVFQSYALYPHMSVRGNMGFALRQSGMARTEIEAKVGAAAALLNITDLLDRKPAALSGGQRQRVAIGRAIVRDPKIFLFDEPLSNLDTELRVRMRFEFAKLHRDLGTTMIYVTHDQVEAMTLADRIVVINNGMVEQVGRPLDLYNHPATKFVAGFIGSPRMNFIKGHLVDTGDNGKIALETENGQIFTLPILGPDYRIGDEISLGIRPEALCLADSNDGEGFSACLTHSEMTGHNGYVYLESPFAPDPLCMVWNGPVPPDVGAQLKLTWDIRTVHVFGQNGKNMAGS